MKDTLNNILFGFLIAVFLFAGAWGGYKLYPSLHPCADNTPDTVYVFDTVLHHIPDTVPFYIVRRDTIVYHDTVFKDIDTVAILRDYYASHYYERTWQDSSLMVLLKDVISQNQPVSNEFTYKILRPQTVIHNEYSTYKYSRYITAGMNLLLAIFLLLEAVWEGLKTRGKHVASEMIEAVYLITISFIVFAGFNGILTFNSDLQFIKVLIGYLLLRFALFDIIWNISASQKINYHGTTKLYDRIMTSLGAFEFILKFTALIWGIAWLTKWGNK